MIDGIRDLLTDINSPDQATEITDFLMKWAERFNIHIIVILHQNKTDTHAMATFNRKLGLTPNQEKAVSLLLTGKSYTEATNPLHSGQKIPYLWKNRQGLHFCDYMTTLSSRPRVKRSW